MGIEFAVAAATCLVTLVLTVGASRMAISRNLLDHPTERSSHSRPVPRSGGIAIVLAVTAALSILAALRMIDTPLLLALLGGGLPVALIGALDDRGSLPVYVRIIVHFAAAAWAVYILGGAAPLYVRGVLVNNGIFGTMLAVISIVWGLNLFNFMDGIDGLAASEAVFVFLGGGIITTSGHSGSAGAALALAAASLGFLIWNWQPARIFMGDTGSGYLGYSVAVLALASGHEQAELLLVWLVLGGVFFVDATVTVLRRLARAERIHEAHRTHAYQWLSRRWKSHQRVTAAVLLVNMCWLLPCAVLAARHPDRAVVIALCALTPVVGAALASGSGRPELYLRNPVASRGDAATTGARTTP